MYFSCEHFPISLIFVLTFLLQINYHNLKQREIKIQTGSYNFTPQIFLTALLTKQ